MTEATKQKDPLKPESFKEYHNYIYQNNFANTPITPILSIDYIKIHYKQSMLQFDKAKNLPSNFIILPRSTRNKYFCQVPIKDNIYELEITHLYKNKLLTGTTLLLRHPSFEFINIIEGFCGSGYTLNSVEYSLDISCENIAEVFRLIKLTSYLSWAGKSFDSDYRSTIYLNDNRKSSAKAAKTYLKDIDGEAKIRLEVILKRRVFDRMNINTMIEACAVPAEEVFKYWKFQVFNYRLFLNNLIDSKSQSFSTEEIKEKILEIEKEFFARVYSKEDGGGVRVMKKILKEKGLPVDKYFAEHEFQNYFFSVINGKTFI